MEGLKNDQVNQRRIWDALEPMTKAFCENT